MTAATGACRELLLGFFSFGRCVSRLLLSSRSGSGSSSFLFFAASNNAEGQNHGSEK